MNFSRTTNYMRILLITYYFPPFNSVGAVRTGKFARWLYEQGHEVRVLTCSNQPFPKGLSLEIPVEKVTAVPGWSVNAPVEFLLGGRGKVIREGYGTTIASNTLIARLGKFYKTLLHWPDGQLGWVGNAIKAGMELLRKEQYDLIYASSSPISSLRVAARLSREAGVPWVAEFRDLWTDNHAYDEPYWRYAIERAWEIRLLRSVSALVTVSGPLVEKLKRFQKPVWEVRNGYDPEDFLDLPETSIFSDSSSQILEIVFTGNVYDAYYDVDTFCKGISLYVSAGRQVRIHVAGRNSTAMKSAAQRFGVSNLFHFFPQLPRSEALSMQQHADVLLAFLWNSPDQEGVYSAKIFEYAGARRPVVAVGAKNDVALLIESSGLGHVCTEPQQLACILAELSERKKSNRTGQNTRDLGYDFTRAAQFARLMPKLEAIVHSELELTSGLSRSGF
jgi:glycosyltransferase involved in cell wall biosynthesis